MSSWACGFTSASFQRFDDIVGRHAGRVKLIRPNTHNHRSRPNTIRSIYICIYIALTL